MEMVAMSNKISLEKTKEFIMIEKKKIAIGTVILMLLAATTLIGGGAYVVNKVLEKSGDSALVKIDSKKPVLINLNWESGEGVLSKKKIDLDLGCLVELTDGYKDVVQPLGKSFGSENKPPYVFLDKDDRSGESPDGENMSFFRGDKIERAVIFTTIYSGADSFQDIKNGRLTIKQEGNIDIVVILNDLDSKGKNLCSVAKITKEKDGLRITKEERYFKSQSNCDEFYGFGFEWSPGKKD